MPSYDYINSKLRLIRPFVNYKKRFCLWHISVEGGQDLSRRRSLRHRRDCLERDSAQRRRARSMRSLKTWRNRMTRWRIYERHSPESSATCNWWLIEAEEQLRRLITGRNCLNYLLVGLCLIIHWSFSRLTNFMSCNLRLLDSWGLVQYYKAPEKSPV